MTAELVAGILELRAKNVKKRDILAQLGCTNGVFDRWGLRGGWSRLPHELTRTLSRMTDYEQHRDRIQKSLQALDYYQDELPVPAIQKKKLLTAEQLALALEAIASRCDLGQKRRGKYIDELGTLVGVPGGTLASWISSKGKLNAPVRNLRNLPGFVLQCERLIASFQQVGAMDTAEEIRCMVLSDRRPITAAHLVEVLLEIAGGSKDSLREMAIQRKLDPDVLESLVTSGGELQVIEALAELPGYSEYADELAMVLSALGHEWQATSLPTPQIPASEFLEQARERFGALVGVARGLASLPVGDQDAMASQAGLSPLLIKTLFGKDGGPRTLDEVMERLSGLEKHQIRAVTDLVRRIGEKYASAPRRGPEIPLQRIDIPPSINAAIRTLLVSPGGVDPGPRVRGRLARIYGKSAELVRAPRTYAHDRQRQILRWLCTSLKAKFPDSVEVQAYFDPLRSEIVLSSNLTAVNKRIKQFLGDGGVYRLIGEMRTSDETALNPREARHMHKLGRRLERRADEAGGPWARAVLDAMANCRFSIPVRGYMATHGRRQLDMHAERRIKNYLTSLGQGVELALLAGTMRPCGSCATDLDLPGHVSRGPYWHSAAGLHGIDIEGAIAQDQRRGFGTAVTLTRAERMTLDCNTDSDSDVSDDSGG
ncbi:hypothetical protein J2797_006374 [Paraburkholderia terricola]|uniref:Uncharacterized protein n=1 Tax=Paraburkholderia terricola TaxID=169427 RepID=A0ABU1M273_9BURK|nr:hypothetical protein [Paraburkholderia terricola]MDR6413103.1 hypothetical protein [Paraburkholderia terricola]MDR6450341.1 hypothetical protein [Paraburkholderia terricola]MDR6485239.1 hypothetical protein [Paraburkholderia terricola]MDR6496447.1 hypothetical protein [Paraburkholderia terricola]